MCDNAGNSTAVLIDRRTGEQFMISRYSTSLGREIGNDLIFNADRTISRQHALIQYVNGKFHLQDLSSKNGTRLNGSQIRKLTELRSGDEICLGLTQLIFVLIPQQNLNMQAVGLSSQTVVQSVAAIA